MSGARGRVMTVSSACASSNTAVGIGADLIRRGELDLVVAGGSDTVSLSVMAGFNALRVISADKTAPFSDPAGLNLGEGAGIVVLKRGDLAMPGCGPPLAELLGYGLSGDAWHATAPDPDGAGCEQAMRRGARRRGPRPRRHRLRQRTRHRHGSQRRGRIPIASPNLRRLHPHQLHQVLLRPHAGRKRRSRADRLSASRRRRRGPARSAHGRGAGGGVHGSTTCAASPAPARPDVIMVNNFGFGGNNSSLIVRAGEGRVPSRLRSRRPDAVVVTGLGIVSAAGGGVERFRRALAAGDALVHRDPDSGIDAAYCPRMRVTDPRLGRFVRGAPATRNAVLALGEALGADKGSLRPRPAFRPGRRCDLRRPETDGEVHGERVRRSGTRERALLPDDDHERDRKRLLAGVRDHRVHHHRVRRRGGSGLRVGPRPRGPAGPRGHGLGGRAVPEAPEGLPARGGGAAGGRKTIAAGPGRWGSSRRR